MTRLSSTLPDVVLAWSRRLLILAAILTTALAARSTLAAEGQVLTLRDPAQAATAQGRSLLKYLVSCALPAEATVEVTVDGEPYRFTGAMGLAPAWAQRDLDEPEQRRVSACILARTNFYGLPVMLSMRSDQPDPVPALVADEAEQREYAFHEGAFFGNLFQPGSPAYVCQARAADAERKEILERTLRVCTLANKQGLPDQLSRCGFLIVGECNAGSFVQNGVDYSAEAIQIHLLPGAPI